MHTVIIGAGILGASAAFHLARAGAEVTVIDAHLDGRATAAGAGIICPWVSGIEDQSFYRLYVAGGEYYPDLIAALADAGETGLGYRQSGAMLVSSDPAELTRLERSVRQRRATAMGEITRLSPQEAQVLFPPLHAGLGGIHVAGGARVDGRHLVAGLLRAAAAAGATIMKGQATLVTEAGRATAVDVAPITSAPITSAPITSAPITSASITSASIASASIASASIASAKAARRIAADRVIVTAGAWTEQVRRLGFSVEPQRGQIVHLRLEGVETQDWPVILPPGSHYIVPFGGGRIVAGATRETGRGFDYRVTAAGQAEVLSEALRIAPGLGVATMIETRVGFRPAGVPLLGWVRGIDGLAVGNGLGAAGLTIGPLAGRLLADLVLGKPGLLDLAPFDPTRSTAADPALAALR